MASLTFLSATLMSSEFVMLISGEYRLTFENRSQSEQCLVLHVTIPTLYDDAVLRMHLEVEWLVVHDDAALYVTSKQGQVFDEGVLVLVGMLSIQSVRYHAILV